MKEKRLLGIVCALAVVVMLWSKQSAAWSDILPEFSDAWTVCEIDTPAASGGSRLWTPTALQRETLRSLLSQCRYTYQRKSSYLQGSYARIYVESSDDSRVELLVSADSLLVNRLSSDDTVSTAYKIDSGNAALWTFICDHAAAA